VHKLTENARFFAQKPHFLHIFAGGRDDFLAGGFWGVFRVWAVARGRRARGDFSLAKSPLSMQAPSRLSKQKNIFYIFHLRCKKKRLSNENYWASKCVTHAPMPTTTLMMVYLQQSGLADRPEAIISLIFIILIFLFLFYFCPAQREQQRELPLDISLERETFHHATQ
jgi:hypothetical protein